MIRVPTIALALLLAPIAIAEAAPVRDFRLPPPRPTSDPDLQGPVDPEAPLPVRSRAAPAPARVPAPVPATPRSTATPRAQRPTPIAPTAPAVAPPAPRAARGAPLPPPTRATASPLPPPRRATAPPAAPVTTPSPDPSLLDPPPPAPVRTDPSPGADPARTMLPKTPGDDDPNWWWLLLLVPVLLAVASFARRGRREKPRPPPAAPVGPPPSPPIAKEPVEIALQPIALTRSLRFVTLECRVTVMNRSGGTLEPVALEGQLSSAHAKAPLEDQLADPDRSLDPLHRSDRLSPGQRDRWEGSLRLSLEQLRVIRQGSGTIFVPLVRLRVVLADGEPVARTHVVGVGRSGARGALQPFRADTPPRSWRELASRPVSVALDAPAPGR